MCIFSLRRRLTKRSRKPAGNLRPAGSICTAFYNWHKELPRAVRKTRGLFYKKVAQLYEEHRASCALGGVAPEKCGGVKIKRRREWLDRWCARFAVSFRKRNRKYTLTAAQRKARLGKFWRDAVRVQKHLFCPPFHPWDENGPLRFEIKCY